MSKWDRFKQGMRDLTPAQLLHGQLVGYGGSAFGILFAWFFLIRNGLWYFSILLFFGFFLQIISFIGTWQKWKEACEINESLSDLEANWNVVEKEMRK